MTPPLAPAQTDLLVVGGGLGGVAAALTAARLGYRVVLTEETDWLGGQLTAQAVPPDEHPYIETPYVSSTYRDLRERIKDYYRRNYPLRPEVAKENVLNPGLAHVSQLCHEPRVAVAVIDELLAPHRSSGRITVLLRHVPLAVHGTGDDVEAVTVRDLVNGHETTISARFVVDATELGELLPLANVEHVVGAEAQSETGEEHAADVANPYDQQAITWCFPLEYRPGEEHVIDKPDSYEHWYNHVDSFWPSPHLSWYNIDIFTMRSSPQPIFKSDDLDDASVRDLWRFRRIRARSQFEPGAFETDLTLANWPNLDYWEAPLVGPGIDEATRTWALRRCKEMSLAYIYWMQTDAPRLDGGTGYPGLTMRPDIVDTADGLAKYVYVRESRRIKALSTIVEEHVAIPLDVDEEGEGSAVFADSVGLGHYSIDLHPSTQGINYINVETYPFQIPLSALIPVRVRNLLPACKNIGTTHITNGCYRLHPVEWSIGEAVGALTAYCLRNAVEPREVAENANQLADYQRVLTDTLGITLTWPDEIRRRRPFAERRLRRSVRERKVKTA